MAAGDEGDVDIQLETAHRQVTVPADFGKGLKSDAGAKQTLDELSYSRKQGT